jgi:hypothetical protein
MNRLIGIIVMLIAVIGEIIKDIKQWKKSKTTD